MPKPVSERIRLINFDGGDADFLYFSVASSTRPDIRHDMAICKRTFIATCTCEDATYRGKRWELLGGDQQDICRHIRSLRKSVLPRLKDLGAI